MTMRNFEIRDYYDSRGQAAHYAQNPELPQWLRNAWQAVADGRISSPVDYHEAPVPEKRQKPAEKRQKPAEKRVMPPVPHTETIAWKIQRENRERALKLMSRRHDPFLDQE